MIQNETELTRTPRHGMLCRAVEAGIQAAHPEQVLAETIDHRDGSLIIANSVYDLTDWDRILVFGGGNGAGVIASQLESILGDVIDGGIVVTDNPVETTTIDVIEGTHPLPTAATVEGTSELLTRAANTDKSDLVLMIITGGGSALLCAPVEGLPLEEYRSVTQELLESGATINEINAIRKHLSRLKGGQLARVLAPSATAALVFSDVVGNRLDVIASGPLAPDDSTYADAIAVCDRYDISLPETAHRQLQAGVDGRRPETPAADASEFDSVEHYILADNRTALEAAASSLADAGYDTRVLSDRIEGEARDIAGMHAQIALATSRDSEPFTPPVAVLSGGEATVTIDGEGRGGPNQEFALQAAHDIADTDVLVAAVDTDGIDGSTSVAGGLVDGDTVDDSQSVEAALADNDSFGYLDRRDAVIRTGPTGTNVNDMRILLVGQPSSGT